MKYLRVVAAILLVFHVTNFAQAEITEDEKRLWLEKFQTGLQQRVSEANVPINFYGKIEDQNGNAVVGAEVEYGVTIYSVTKVLDVTTGFITSGSGGTFEINNEKGESLSIREVKKKGYTYYVTQNPKTSFDYWAYGSENRFVSNENEPVVFYMRKQDELAFTMKSNQLMSKDLDFGKVFYGSLKDGRVWPSDHPRFNFQRDFELVAQKRDGQDPLLTITALGDNSGIILSDETVFIAPATGYNKSLEIICQEDKKYTFFMKNSDGLYARIEGDFSSMEPDHPLLRTDITSWLNPYGDRNLETDSDIPVEIWIQLEKEAKAAFRDNKIPVKPDFQQLIGGQ